MTPLLNIKNISIKYDEKSVVDDVSLSVNQGEILAIIGESGSGKSTLIKSAMRLLGNDGRISDGNIFYKGRDIMDFTEKEFCRIRGNEMGMIFQNSDSAFCPVRTIGNLLYESLSQSSSITKEEVYVHAKMYLEKLGFKDTGAVLNKYPFELSVGMNQRIGVMMALMMNPSLMFADEPTSALDVVTQKKVIDELMDIRRDKQLAIVIVTHNIGVAKFMADNIAVMKQGRIVEYGSKKDVIFSPKNEYTKSLINSVPKLKRG